MKPPLFHRAEAFLQKKPRNFRSEALAAGEGFEPSHTESESAVLPLHKPAIFLFVAVVYRSNRYYYTKK